MRDIFFIWVVDVLRGGKYKKVSAESSEFKAQGSKLFRVPVQSSELPLMKFARSPFEQNLEL
jgi:hypothetical protein